MTYLKVAEILVVFLGKMLWMALPELLITFTICMSALAFFGFLAEKKAKKGVH